MKTVTFLLENLGAIVLGLFIGKLLIDKVRSRVRSYVNYEAFKVHKDVDVLLGFKK